MRPKCLVAPALFVKTWHCKKRKWLRMSINTIRMHKVNPHQLRAGCPRVVKEKKILSNWSKKLTTTI